MTGVERQHPRHRLNDVIHSPVRLSIIATLAAAGEVEFKFLRDTVEVSDSLLSKHISTLESAGLVKVVKGYVGKRPNTWFSLTERGHREYARYKEILRQIMDQ